MTQTLTLNHETVAILNQRSTPFAAVLAVKFAVCVTKMASRRRTRKALAQLAHTVVARLEDSDFSVRSRAVEAVAKLEPAARDKFAGALVARLA